MFYQSMRGRYSVDVGADGAIKVKPGDWLSKYSAAIHANYYTTNVFYRKNRRGHLERLANPNLIYAGEILYHLPTYKQHHAINDFGKPLEVIGLIIPVLSDAEKKRLTLEHLKKEFNLRGDIYVPVLTEAMDIIGTPGVGKPGLSDLLTLAECAGLIAEGGALATASTVLTFAGIFLMPVAGTIMLINAKETGLRHIGMRAVAYATTAWAFGDLIPGPPAWIRPTITPAMVQKSILADPGSKQTYQRAQANEQHDIATMQKAWNDAAESTVKNLEGEVVKKKVQKTSYQVLLRATGENDRQTLADVLMKNLEKEIKSEAVRKAYWQPSPRYPSQ